MTNHERLNLALDHHKAGRFPEAEALYRHVLSEEPNQSDALHGLALIAQLTGQPAAAEELFQRAIALRPDIAAYWLNFGNTLRSLGRIDAAADAFATAVRLQPDSPEAQNNFGNIRLIQGHLDEAMQALSVARRLQPGNAGVLLNLANVFKSQRRVDDSVDLLRQAAQLDPSMPEVQINLGNALKDQGLLDESIAAYRTALKASPDNAPAHSNLCLTVHYHPGFDAAAIKIELDDFNRRHAEPLKRFIRPYLSDRDPNRRLRVGYVSGDFRIHAQSFFTVPLLQNHDHQAMEIFCYSHTVMEDEITRRIRGYADVWRNTLTLSDGHTADLIRQDKIDVLIDPVLHAAGNRMLVFAAKPAPVQIAWLGYPGSTGLTTMDYRITDNYLDPPGMNDAFYSEQSIRLPDCFWCYDPLTTEPAVGDPPFVRNGFITFGCLNHFSKVNDQTLTLWSQVMRQVPNSRLLIYAFEGRCRSRTLQTLANNGIAAERVDFVGHTPRPSYLAAYNRIDIALDTFPYTGHTTTCDCLWMSVPLVSLVGPKAVSRGGLTLLSNAGLPELAANTPEDFLKTAVNLATDPARLAHLRATLRQRIQDSPIMNGPAFARAMGNAYRQAWQTWCAKS